MANNIELATIFNTVLDETMEQEAVTSWMEGNAPGLEYVDGKYVKVPKMAVSGFGNYTRGGSYPTGTVAVANQQFEMTQDRAVKLAVDILDKEESKQVASGSNIIATFGRDNAIPEIDAYRHAKLFEYANKGLRTKAYAPDVSTIYGELSDNIAEVQDLIGESYDLVIHMSIPVAQILAKSSELSSKFIISEGTMEFTSSTGRKIVAKVATVDGSPIRRVKSNRMYSAITLNTGAGENPTFGYAKAATGMNLNWIIMARSAPVAVRKLNDMKIIASAQNPDGRDDIIIPNVVHDLWVFDNKVAGLFVSYQAIAAPALAGTHEAGAAAGTKFTATGVAAGNTLGYVVSDTELTTTLPKYNQILKEDEYTPYTSGADIVATATQYLIVYELDANKRVMAVYQSICTNKVHA